MSESIQKKSPLPLVMSFILGGVITFLVMNLLQSRNEVETLRNQLTQNKNSTEQTNSQDKHWMDEMIEKRAKETEQRIKEQQSEGDAYQNQFQQFAN